MLPNAFVSTSPYADLLSHLKAMDYAIQRAIDDRMVRLTELDRERLVDTAVFLREEVGIPRTEVPSHPSSVAPNLDDDGDRFTLDLDLLEQAKDVPAFSKWLPSLSARDKMTRLVEALDEYVEVVEEQLTAKPRAPECLQILHDIINSLSSVCTQRATEV